MIIFKNELPLDHERSIQSVIDKAPSKNWRWSSAVVRNAAPIGFECKAPSQDGKCLTCRVCWSRDVKTVSYHKH